MENRIPSFSVRLAVDRCRYCADLSREILTLDAYRV